MKSQIVGQTCFHLSQCHVLENQPQSVRLRRKEAKLLCLLKAGGKPSTWFPPGGLVER